MKRSKRTVWEKHQLVLRIPEALKDRMRRAAAKQGISINRWATEQLTRVTRRPR